MTTWDWVLAVVTTLGVSLTVLWGVALFLNDVQKAVRAIVAGIMRVIHN